MPKPRRSDSVRWTSSKYAMGYCYRVGETVYTAIGQDRRTTNLKWLEKNKAKALRMLEERIEKKLFPQTEPVPLPPTPKLYDIAEEYMRLKDKDRKPTTTDQIRPAFRRLLPRDMPLDFDQVVAAITATTAASTYSDSTRQQDLKVMRAFFKWCINRGLLPRNPIDLFPAPRIGRSTVEVYTPEEIEAYVGLNSRKRSTEPYALLFRLLSLTALRIAEALALRWEDVTIEGFQIRGKGDRPRVFPFEPFGGVAEIFHQMREHTGQEIYVFPWREQTSPYLRLKRTKFKIAAPAMEALARSGEMLRRIRGSSSPLRAELVEIIERRASGPIVHLQLETELVIGRAVKKRIIRESHALELRQMLGSPLDGRALHTFRKTCINRWRREGITMEVRALLAGHSPAVQDADYLTDPTIAEVAELLRRAS